MDGLRTDASAQRSWLVDEAYGAIKDAILANEYAPGRQVSAQELAGRFGMSRTPVQEAALRLQQEGLLEILPKRGIRIKALSAEDLTEIYDVLVAIEGHAAGMIAGLPRIDRKAAVATLEQATATMADCLSRLDPAGWAQADAEFHRGLIDFCGNTRFQAIVRMVNAQAHRVRTVTAHLRRGLEASTSDHLGIVRAIANGDTDRASTLARLHRLRARDELLPLLETLGLKCF